MIALNERLTGEVRLRLQIRWFRSPLLVVQVHVAYGDGPDDCYGMPQYLAGNGWRDAKVEDDLRVSLHGGALKGTPK